MHLATPARPSRLRSLAMLASAAATLCVASTLCLPAISAAAPVAHTFSSPANTGTAGTYVVPAGVTSIHVEAVGAKGGDVPAGSSPFAEPFPLRTGGFGGVVSGNLPVVPGETLYVYVGGNGEEADGFGPVAGGANGGGASGPGVASGGGGAGGGGASDVRTIVAPSSGPQTTSLESRVLVAAGGGGGATATNAGSPGNGDGGNAEEPGNSAYAGEPAFPGVANPNGTGEGGEGGTGGCCHGENGSLGNGGAGAGDGFFGGGGGGAGLYGGGGGSSYFGQPGAGGASWVEQSATGASVGPIDSTGEPRVTISYEPPATPAPVSAPLIPSVAIALAPIAPMLSGFKPLHRCSTSVELGKLGSGSGLAFSFTLSETSNVTFAVLHRVGSPAWSRCPRVRGHDPGSYRSMGQLSGLVPAGNNTLTMGTAARARHVRTVTRFGRGRHRISLAKIASKHLPPGTYVLSAKAVNSAGQSSGVAYAKFWVIR